MTTWEILQDSVTYQEIVAEAKLEGRLEGIQQSMTQMLTLRFGPLPSWVEDKIRKADSQTLDRWTDQYHTATTLDEVLK